MRLATVPLLATLTACGASPAPEPAPPPDRSPAPALPEPPAVHESPAQPTKTADPAPEPCGALSCQLFSSPEAAFQSVLAKDPLVLAVGETHALKGTHVPSTTRRFTESLLPLLEGHASDLVLEIWVPNPDCKKKVAEVSERQRPITEKQAAGNQNEFVTLGNESKRRGIRPHVLRPPCEEYEKILAAGGGDVAQMLEMIARLTADLTKRILERNQKGSVEKMVVAYGGAMHNDLVPREGREAWTFGPALQQHTESRYVAIDLIVREFIRDTAAWKALPWYPHFDPSAHPDKAVLFEPNPGSYVLVFPKSEASP